MTTSSPADVWVQLDSDVAEQAAVPDIGAAAEPSTT